MENQWAIQISGLKKQYRLGQIGGGTLQGDLQSWWARVRGKEDPNTKIGAQQRSNGETFMALNGVDLQVRKGEALGIIGGNGAGKSTLLKILSRVTAPSEGTVDLYGRITSMLEVGTGFNGEMTGRENVYLNGAILGMTKAEIDAKMAQIIEFSEVGEFIDTPVKRYSSGMYVKLAFSVAAHLDSEIMIMDEVLAVGDMAFQQKCLKKMGDAAHTQGKTVLYVSHNMNTIRQLCDRCVVLDKGRIVFDGDVEKAIEIYMGEYENVSSHYDYEKVFRYRQPNDFRMLSLDMEQNEKDAYLVGEKIRLQLHYHTRIAMNDLRIRFEVHSSDGPIIGTMFTDVLPKMAADETGALSLELDMAGLVEGRYRIDIVAYVHNGLGGEIILDAVYPGLLVELKEPMTDEVMQTWLHKWWGCVRLQDIRLIESN